MMHRAYHHWWSPALEREMELLVFGHGGARVIAFPTATGRFYEWEDHCMIDSLSEPLERGWFHLFCVDSVDHESWYNYHAPPGHRAWRHVQYERYILREVVPFTWHCNQTPFLIAAGADFGAYHAINITLRNPQIFQRALGMSGRYDISTFVDGYEDNLVYFNNPMAFVRNIEDPHLLRQLRQSEFILSVGQEEPDFAANRTFSRLLWSRGIWHAFRSHEGLGQDWPSWRQMVHDIGGAD